MSISIENKLTIKHWIRNNRDLANWIHKETDTVLQRISTDTGLSVNFLMYNLKQIKNWV